MNKTIRYFLEITNHGGSFEGRLSRVGYFETSTSLPDLKLAPDDSVEIKNKTFIPLHSLLESLIRFDRVFLEDLFDERGQLEVGRYLYRQTFGRLEQQDRKQLPTEGDVEVWVITEDEHVARLPWVLLARDSDFLCTTGWSVSVARNKELLRRNENHELPPAPRMLVIMPELGAEASLATSPETSTGSAEHLAELETMLADADPRFRQGQHLQIARTLEELSQKARDYQPDLIYFYGHGEGNLETSRLLFARGEEVPVIDFADRLREACDRMPSIVYVNCCGGDAGGALGVGWRLGKYVPAVITNRTVAYAPAARRQALELWRAVLLEGLAPHAAVAGMYSKLGNLGLSRGDSRWLTPICHRNYLEWLSNPTRTQCWANDDPHWPLKLDRVSQFSEVFYRTYAMLNGGRPRSQAFVWYGREDQGIDRFHERLPVELDDVCSVYRVRPEWPRDLVSAERSFADMLSAAFEVSNFDQIPSSIRTRGRGERQTLVYVCHEPLRHPYRIADEDLKRYVTWWDRVFNPLLEEASAVGLLGISYQVPGEAIDREAMDSEAMDSEAMDSEAMDSEATAGDAPEQTPGADLTALELRRTGFKHLGELKPLAAPDMWEFLITQKCNRTPEVLRQVLHEILDQTRGTYEATVEELERRFC